MKRKTLDVSQNVTLFITTIKISDFTVRELHPTITNVHANIYSVHMHRMYNFWNICSLKSYMLG